MYFPVNLHINDKLETKIKFTKINRDKEKKDLNALLEEKTMTTTETWITKEPGKAVRYFDVVLNRQTGNYEILFQLSLDAKLKYKKEVSETGEDSLPSLPEEREVPPVPYIKDYLQNLVIIPTDGNTPNDKMAGFGKKFSPLNSTLPLLGCEETKAATVTVSYRLH